ncbi:MAG TPA: PIG-L deacetylase family protein [Pseudonocardia sp.]|nr:PIG-L deacetylase family protein [Pseudonocardia sp.]
MHSTSDLHGHTVLALHAHPDDEAIFTGITLRRLADAGARVVLVLATAGELGESRVPLGPSETIGRRRTAELERSAALLGVSRLVLLGRRDSGLPGWTSGAHPRALAGADPHRLARRVARIAEAEGAETLIYDDAQGIYGHPDHHTAHRVGHGAAELTGAASYQITVDREHLAARAPGGHLVHGAAAAAEVHYGRPTEEITLAVSGTAADLARKYAAITAHASQVAPEHLPPAAFEAAYGTEWYRREGAPGLLDRLTQPERVAQPVG